MDPLELELSVQVGSGFHWDILQGHLDIGASFEILFKAAGQDDYGPVVATLSGGQLLRALCSAVTALAGPLRAACSKV